MSLSVKTLLDEEWRDCVKRYATEYSLEKEALADFDRRVAAGTGEATAAWEALYELDLLDYEEED
jgi:hypothetical protein